MSEIAQLHKLALKALNHQQYNQAQQVLIQILRADKNHYDSYFLLGVIEAELGQFTKAVNLIEKALSIKTSAEYYAHLAKCYAMLGDTVKTHNAVSKAEEFTIKAALTLDTIGVALSRLGEHKLAINYFERAITKKQSAAFHYNLGTSQTFSGLFDKARHSLEQAIKIEPYFYQAHSSLSHLGGITRDFNHIERLKQVFEQVTHPDGKLHISHALARELEAVEEYSEAFKYLYRAKAEKQKVIKYDFNRDQGLFNEIQKLFSDSLFSNKMSGNDSAQAIFVTGMPRSGTTLVERVLTNAKKVKSVGELQDFGLSLKRLANTPSRFILDNETIQASTNIDYSTLGQNYLNCVKPLINEGQRFVDKMPLNVLYAGHIIKALPSAKVLCVIRNPMDTIWGNYKQMFSLNDPYYQYAFDQSDIAKYYVEFVKLAQFWQSLYPNNFKIVSYDSFVTSPLECGKDVVEFCNIAWSDSLLDITKNDSAVATASSVQVRSGINTKSLGQWKRFENELKPALKVIQAAGVMV